MSDFEKYDYKYRRMLSSFDIICISVLVAAGSIALAFLAGFGVIYLCERFDLINSGW